MQFTEEFVIINSSFHTLQPGHLSKKSDNEIIRSVFLDLMIFTLNSLNQPPPPVWPGPSCSDSHLIDGEQSIRLLGLEMRGEPPSLDARVGCLVGAEAMTPWPHSQDRQGHP